MPTVVDTLSDIFVLSAIGDGGPPGAPYYSGQTFVAAGSALDSIALELKSYIGVFDYRLLVTTVTTGPNGINPGTVLFESGKLTLPDADGTQLVTVSTGKIALTPGQTYAFIVDAFADKGTPASEASIQMSHYQATGPDYTGGFSFALISAPGTTRSQHFAADWKESMEPGGGDLAFRMVFSNPGVTVLGTTKGETIDATHAPKNQPLPGGLDDTIFGLKGKDKLFGLGGDDQLSGGKGRDHLTGGDGEDRFLFDVGLKQPADKILDFNPADDTILLAVAKFKALTPGVLSEAAFRDIGEASSPEARVIYKASGKLLYDKDGPGGADAVAFAKLVGAPDIGAADLLVV